MTTCATTLCSLWEPIELTTLIEPSTITLPEKLTKDNSCYMCPRCLYSSYQRSDMVKHLNRKNKCNGPYLCKFSDRDVVQKAFNLYYFHGVTTFPTLSISQKINMVNKYNDNINLIYHTSMLFSPNESKYASKTTEGMTEETTEEMTEGITEEMTEGITEEMTEETTEEMTEETTEEMNEETTEEMTEETTEEMTEKISCKNNSFQCIRCMYTFKCKRNLINHYINKKSCDERINMNKLQKKLSIITQIEKKLGVPLNPVVDIIKKKDTLKLRDFIYENFDYSHIDINAVFDLSFFNHESFLSTIFSNDVNKNVYFDEKYGYFYMDGMIYRDRCDRVGYIVMEKLAHTLKSFIQKNPLIDPADYSHIIKFYSVEKLKYCMDTIYKSYDFEKREYVPNICLQYRTRDHYLTTIINSINYYKDWTLTIIDILQISNEVTDYKLELPDNYQAVQLRYAVSRKPQYDTTILDHRKELLKNSEA